MKILSNKILNLGPFKNVFLNAVVQCMSKKFVCKAHILFSYQKRLKFFWSFWQKKRVSIQGTLQTVSISISFFCSYLLHIAQLQPKWVPQLRQCYKLHMPRVQRCHHWSLSPFCPHHWLQLYFHYYTVTIEKNLNIRKNVNVRKNSI